jgi:hypothetical protein
MGGGYGRVGRVSMMRVRGVWGRGRGGGWGRGRGCDFFCGGISIFWEGIILR